MNLRWLFFDYVDPALQLTQAQRRAIRSKAIWSGHHAPAPPHKVETPIGRWDSRWFPFMAALVPGFAGFVATVIQHQLDLGWLGIPFALLVMFALVWLAFAVIGSIVFKPVVSSILREQGHDLCVECGYWLRGLVANPDRCPECGWRRSSRVEAEAA